MSVSSPPSLVPVVLGRSPYRTGAVHPHAGPAALSRDAQTLWLASWRGLASPATCDGLTLGQHNRHVFAERPAVAYCERMVALGMQLERATLGPPSPARRRAPTNAPTGDVPRP